MMGLQAGMNSLIQVNFTLTSTFTGSVMYEQPLKSRLSAMLTYDETKLASCLCIDYLLLHYLAKPTG
jgi:hypothetical protein